MKRAGSPGVDKHKEKRRGGTQLFLQIKLLIQFHNKRVFSYAR